MTANGAQIELPQRESNIVNGFALTNAHLSISWALSRVFWARRSNWEAVELASSHASGPVKPQGFCFGPS